MKIARFKVVEYDIETVGDMSLAESDKYIQISEPVEVDFIPLNRDVIVNAEINSIDEAIKSIRVAAQFKTNELERRKSELLALPSS